MQRALWTIRRFWHDTRAVLSVEAVLIFPLLIWGYAGFFTLYDSYRSKVLNIQAAYTVSDLLSRERNVIDDDYIAGLHNVYRQVTHARQTSFLRITVLQYDATNDDHILLWSRATPGFDDLTDATRHTIMIMSTSWPTARRRSWSRPPWALRR